MEASPAVDSKVAFGYLDSKRIRRDMLEFQRIFRVSIGKFFTKKLNKKSQQMSYHIHGYEKKIATLKKIEIQKQLKTII